MHRYSSALLLFVMGAAPCTTPDSACVMSPAVRQALNALPNAWDYRIPYGSA